FLIYGSTHHFFLGTRHSLRQCIPAFVVFLPIHGGTLLQYKYSYTVFLSFTSLLSIRLLHLYIISNKGKWDKCSMFCEEFKCIECLYDSMSTGELVGSIDVTGRVLHSHTNHVGIPSLSKSPEARK